MTVLRTRVLYQLSPHCPHYLYDILHHEKIFSFGLQCLGPAIAQEGRDERGFKF